MEPVVDGALRKVDEIVARLQQLQSTIQVTRSMAACCIRHGAGAGEGEGEGEGEGDYDAPAADWTQWSHSAEFVHAAVSDIVKDAKGLSRRQESAQAADTEGAPPNPDSAVDFDAQTPAPAPAPAPVAPSVKVTKVKQTQKGWIKPTKPDAIMFPNAAYDTNPQGLKQFKVKHPEPNRIGAVNMHKLRANRSPVSLPALIDRLPSKRPATRTRPSPLKLVGSGLQVPPAYISRGNGSKVLGASNKVCMDEDKRQGAGPSKPSMNINGAKSISPRPDKENQLTCATTSTLRRSWSAGNTTVEATNTLGLSMLQRAKGWMLGRQHQANNVPA